MNSYFVVKCIVLGCFLSSSIIIHGFQLQSLTFNSRCSVCRSPNSKIIDKISIRQDLTLDSVTESSAAGGNNIYTYSVDEVLDLISETDKGAAATPELQQKVNSWMEIKSNEYKESISLLNKKIDSNSSSITVLDDENLFGNYDVSFVSTLKASKQQGNPAGGNFRGSFGRFIYENEGLYQHIVKEDDVDKDIAVIGQSKDDVDAAVERLFKNDPVARLMDKIDATDAIPDNVLENVPKDSSLVNDIASDTRDQTIEVAAPQKKSRILAINYITGKLFRIFTVSVILKGVLQQITESERTELTAKYGTPLSPGTIRADFESPLISIGGVSIRIGPNSNVVLDTPYLDDKIRLGLGARGSSFIFKRTNDKKANNWKIDIKRKPLKAKNLGFLFVSFGALVLNLFASNNLAFIHILKKVVAFPIIFLGLILFFTKGGIRDDENTILPEKK